MDDSLSPAAAPGRCSPLSPEAITAAVRSVVERQVATTRAGKALTALDAALVANLVQNIVGNVSMIVAGMVDEARAELAEGVSVLAAPCATPPATRDCTCLGSCKGADGLAPGWRCALEPRDTAATGWSWRDRTEDMAAQGYPARQTRYVEVYADGRCTVACIDETGISHWSGVEIDWLDVVLADVNGRRLHELVGADGEREETA